MPKVKYRDINMGAARLATVAKANAIIEEYQAQGFNLTLRQLYYQFVARDLIPNKQTEYKRLGDIINDARLAGLVDWLAITDRTRNLHDLPHWSNPSHIVEAVSQQFRIDKWARQPERVEVWIEKDALIGVIGGICEEWDVPYFSCRGYTSQSEMWVAAQRMIRRRGQPTTVLHLGDHDPSGVDMSRDIEDRLSLFGAPVRFKRIALNMAQVEEHQPPPNPAKLTDSRSGPYVAEFGDESWELDALSPTVLAGLIEGEIRERLDGPAWLAAEATEQEGRDGLAKVADRYEEVVDWLSA